MEAFLNAVALKITDTDLPIENANLWHNFILPCKTNIIDLKQSSYKKLGKFFQFLDKEGMIKYEEANKK